MHRELTDHKVNPANDVLAVIATDEAGDGGASHRYVIRGYDASTNPAIRKDLHDDATGLSILFQNGPIGEVGVNGITHEALLAILCDRMRGFQSGPFANRYNALALTKLEEAQMWLNRRTVERMQRGVEGTHEK